MSIGPKPGQPTPQRESGNPDTRPSIKDLLEKGVLYIEAKQRLRAQNNSGLTTTYFIAVPYQIELFCPDHKCRRAMDFKLDSGGREGKIYTGGISEVTYSCGYSGRSVVFIVFVGKEGTVSLIGRMPRATVHIQESVSEAVGDFDLYLYSNALESRRDGRGIGAVTYMRRVVENEMDRLMELLEEEVTALVGESPQLDEVRRLRGTHQFKEKAAAADLVLPKSFFPGEANPFTRLHDLVSDGVHNLDDFQSCEVFDEAKVLFELLFEKLLREADSRRLYAEKLTKLKIRPPRAK